MRCFINNYSYAIGWEEEAWLPFSARLWLGKTLTYDACMKWLRQIDCRYHRKKIKKAKVNKEKIDESMAIHQVYLTFPL